MKISVIGLGYLGLVHAACMADLGHTVIGCDVIHDRIELLRNGGLSFFEEGVEDMVTKNRDRLSYYLTGEAPLEDCDVHFICVGTPEGPDGRSDTEAVLTAFKELLAVCREDAVIVVKSTCPPGYSDVLLQTISSQLKRVTLLWNPEYLAEGTAIEDTLRPRRIVIGAGSAEAAGTLLHVYRDISQDVPRIVMSLRSAEIEKMAANSFLALKISYANTLAQLCTHFDADVRDIMSSLSLDPRIGSGGLKTGIGYGGGCFPKDVRALRAAASEAGVSGLREFLYLTDAVNRERRTEGARLVRRLTDSVASPRIAVLGLTFKEGTDDCRDSPAADLARALAGEGMKVCAFDPALHSAYFKGIEVVHDINDALRGANCVVVATPWSEFVELDPALVGEVVASKTLVDVRNVMPLERWTRAGWIATGLGAGSLKSAVVEEPVS